MNKLYFITKFIALAFLGTFVFQLFYFLPTLISKGIRFSEGWIFIYFIFFSIATTLGYLIFSLVSFLVKKHLNNIDFGQKLKNYAFITGFLLALVIGVLV